MAKTAIERLPDTIRGYIEEALTEQVPLTEILTQLRSIGHPEVTKRQLQHYRDKFNLTALDTAGKTLRAVANGKLSLSSDDALLSVLADALEQLDRLGALVRSHHNSRLERILADSYPAVFSMLKEVSFDAGELKRVRALEGAQEGE